MNVLTNYFLKFWKKSHWMDFLTVFKVGILVKFNFCFSKKIPMYFDGSEIIFFHKKIFQLFISYLLDFLYIIFIIFWILTYKIYVKNTSLFSLVLFISCQIFLRYFSLLNFFILKLVLQWTYIKYFLSVCNNKRLLSIGKYW